MTVMLRFLMPTRFICLLMTVVVSSFGQPNEQQSNVYIDEAGVMRFESDQSEVKGFGVNYTVPFAHAYRSALRMGIDPKQAIDEDIYHFKRLGFDLFRVHVWDTQISDVQGHLIENEYLDAFDYLIAQLKKHGFNYVITPIAYWGNGWPEPDTPSPGFSSFYGKDKCLTDPKAIEAQATYLYEFLNHVNPYTNLSFAQDPNTLAFEVSNEPHHRGDGKQVKAFVRKMIVSMRKTGTAKPIFYNMSHGVHFVQDYFDGGAEGGTFQWYPTGLSYQSELPGNVLPNVNDYKIPFDEVIKKNKGAKLVYEFDVADVGRSYPYPALARSFRTAGIQIATHFAYDPTFLAPYNTEYNTHYMNLVYTPQKALALKICSEIFHDIDLYSNFGTYPENTKFGNTTVDYHSDLATYDSGDKFFYTNSTTQTPKSPDSIKEIAGFGNSQLVKYSGKGAYFLDQLDKGVWRLEVMPDAAWVQNPFGRNSPDQLIGIVQHNSHPIEVNIKELGHDFSYINLLTDEVSQQAVDSKFTILPGVYVLNAAGVQWTSEREQEFDTYSLTTYHAPVSNVTANHLSHQSPTRISANETIDLKLQYVSVEKPKSIAIRAYLNNESIVDNFKALSLYEYHLTLPKDKLQAGMLYYHIVVEQADGTVTTYPEERNSSPMAWDFFQSKPYNTAVVDANEPVLLFSADRDAAQLIRTWRKGISTEPKGLGNAELVLRLEQLGMADPENAKGEVIQDYTVKHNLMPYLNASKQSASTKTFLTIEGKSLNQSSYPVQIALIMDNGAAFGAIVELQESGAPQRIELTDLKPVKTVTLPRPYPTFLPYYFDHNNQEEFDLLRTEFIQISLGPGMSTEQINGRHELSISKIYLE